MSRHESREQAFCLLFEKDFKDETLEEIIESAQLARDIEVSDFTKEIFNGVIDNKSKINELIEKNLIGWKISRLSKVTLNILRIAIYEILFVKDIPINVSINEAVEISKIYTTEEDTKFINGILSTICKDLETLNV